jgi:hypothetical protein
VIIDTFSDATDLEQKLSAYVSELLEDSETSES